MSTNPIKAMHPPVWPRWALRCFAVALILLELSAIQSNYRVVEMYAPPDAQNIWDEIARLRIFHLVRIGILFTLVIGFRWSIWLILLAYLTVYIPNPWISATLVNGFLSMSFLVLITLLTIFPERQFLFPWRKQELRN